MNDFPNREVEVFTETLRLPAEEWDDYLSRACGGDFTLRQRVEALLKTHGQVGDFLERGAQPGSTVRVVAGEKSGDRIGRYKLLQQIGEGGCGVVYMAEQEEPIRRRVALKIIKAGMDTKNVIARFEAERQALAMMDHPNIAKVLDAGATNSGRPYFVMELVRGVKITTYCDEHALTTEERLNLFIQVCQAVQHAHQKGVIHRDIKPSNILVTETQEGFALPVVIDFGIAKATTNQRLTDKTLFTAFEMLIGTPAYMSPEQAVLTSVDVDTRTDIYSLGVLLYELVTGSTPFDAGALLKAGLDEVRRVISQEEPPRPSTRLSKMTQDDLTYVALHRKAEAPRLIRTVRGDLDWIAMKALEKDRTRRYETANGLALDVKRFLDNETVSARPPSASYRLQKMIARHKMLFASIGAVTVMLVASLVLISASLARERRARREADAARQQAEVDKVKAEAAAAKSQQVTQFLQDLLKSAGPYVALGRDPKLLREILDKAADRIGTELSNQPATMAELQNIIGGVYTDLLAYDKAETMHRAALAENRVLYGNESKEVADSLYALGVALTKHNKYSEAKSALREALAIRQKLFGDEHADVATAMYALAGALFWEGKIDEAEVQVRAALVVWRKALGNDHPDVATALIGLSVMLLKQEKYVEAGAVQREALAIQRKMLPAGHPDIASSIGALCLTLSQEQGSNLDEVETLAREALAIRRKALPDSLHVGASLYILSEVLRKENKLAEAESAIRDALANDHKLVGEDHSAVLLFQQELGVILADQERLADAETVLRDTLVKWRKTKGSAYHVVGRVLSDLGSVLLKQGKLPEAEASYRESVAILRQALGPKSSVLAISLAGLGAVLHQQGKEAEAEALLTEATTIEHQAFGEGNPLRVRSLGRLRVVLEAQGKTAEAEAIRRELERSQLTEAPAAAKGNAAKQP